MRYKRYTMSGGTFLYIDNDDMSIEITITKKSRGKYLIDINIRLVDDTFHLDNIEHSYSYDGSLTGAESISKRWVNQILENNNLKVG